jgi:hypothetical protein
MSGATRTSPATGPSPTGRARLARMPRGLVPSLLVLAAGWALSLWVGPWSDDRVNDLFVYRSFTDLFLSGAVPYRDIAFEYPPLAAPAIALPGVLGTGEEAFRWAYAGWTLLGAAAVVVLCGALARATGGDARRAMLAAALMPLLCGAVLRTHFDLFPVALLLGALLLLCRDHPRAGMALLGLGVVMKAFPLVAAPIAVAWLAAGHGAAGANARRARGDAWQAALACLAVIAVVAGAALLASPDGAVDAARYHVDRPVQVESSPALVLLGLDAVGLGEATSVSSYKSDGLLHPASEWITSLFLAALVVLVTLLCATVRDRRGGATPAGANGAAARMGADAAPAGAEVARRRLVLASFAAVIGFALLGKVLSPQFVIWVAPLGALALAWRRYALAAAVAAAAVLTQVEFPAHYFDVVAREPLALAVVVARNLALLAALVLAVRELQPRRHQQLVDARRAALAVRLD